MGKKYDACAYCFTISVGILTTRTTIPPRNATTMWSTAPHLASTDFVDSQVAEKSDALVLARPAAASKEAAEILQTVLSVSIGYKGGLLSRWQSPRPSHIKVLLSNREGNEKKSANHIREESGCIAKREMVEEEKESPPVDPR